GSRDGVVRRNGVNLAAAGRPPGATAAGPDQPACRGARDRELCAPSDGVRRSRRSRRTRRRGGLCQGMRTAALKGGENGHHGPVLTEVENSAEWREFRERLRNIVSAPRLIPPHISLLYTLDGNSQAPRPDLDAERLKAIATGCAEAIDDAHFTLGRPVVNSAG